MTDPTVPVIMRLYVPAGVLDAVLTFRVVEPGTGTGLGVKLVVMELVARATDALRLTHVAWGTMPRDCSWGGGTRLTGMFKAWPATTGCST